MACRKNEVTLQYAVIMKYIQQEDLIEVIQERLLDDSTQFTNATVEGLEEKAIAFVKSYISGLYRTDEIFGNTVLRHPILTFVIARLVVYWSVRRNAARKVPEDYKAIYDEAISILTKIQSGVQTLDGMPAVTDENGNQKLMWGNTTNPNHFI